MPISILLNCFHHHPTQKLYCIGLCKHKELYSKKKKEMMMQYVQFLAMMANKRILILKIEIESTGIT